MPPKLRADDGRNIVIRPLAYCRERDILKYARLKEFPIIPCNLCGSQGDLQRRQIKQMLNDWDKQYPGRTNSIFRALQNVAPSQLADGRLFDFERLGDRPRGKPRRLPVRRPDGPAPRRRTGAGVFRPAGLAQLIGWGPSLRPLPCTDI